MKKIELTPMNIYLAAAIELIPYDELMALILEFDKTAERPTVALLTKLFEEYGHDFADPFAKLALEAAETPEAQDKVRKKAKQLSKATGSTGVTLDSEKGLSWFSNISNFILDGIGKSTSLISAINGMGEETLKYQIELLRAQQESEKTTRTIIGWSIGGLAVLVIFFFMYKMFSRH